MYRKDVKTEYLSAFQETWQGRLQKNRETGHLARQPKSQIGKQKNQEFVTTGIRDGPRVRSCAKIFGQVKLGVRVRAELAGSRKMTGAVWTASQLIEVGHARKLALQCRASRTAVADLYLVTVTERLVGELQMDSWDASRTPLVSFSKWRSRHEVMLLMRPFAWLRGSKGSAVPVVNAGKCEWNITSW